MTISTAGLTQSIRNSIATVRRASPGARERLLLTDDAAAIAAAVRRGLRTATADDVAVHVTARGGFVPSSYKYSADADEVRVNVDLITGKVAVSADRVRAQTRPRGSGDWLTTHLRRDGQTQGRILR